MRKTPEIRDLTRDGEGAAGYRAFLRAGGWADFMTPAPDDDLERRRAKLPRFAEPPTRARNRAQP